MLKITHSYSYLDLNPIDVSIDFKAKTSIHIFEICTLQSLLKAQIKLIENTVSGCMHKETQCNVSGHDQTVFMDKGETSAASTLFPLAGHHNEDEDEEKKSKDAWMQCTSFPLEKVMPKKAPDAAALGEDGLGDLVVDTGRC